MATYAIGDVQGCFEPFQRLLKAIDFAPGRDRLWLVGDLVNRGPQSLEILRWAKAHQDHVTTVLGNHDLHLLAVAAGVRESKRGDTLEHVLQAPDCTSLLDWLAARPLLVREGDSVLVHAGVHPTWTAEQAVVLAAEVSARLQEQRHATLEKLYAAKPEPLWRDDFSKTERLRAVVAVLTRMRMLRPDGSLDLQYSGPPNQAPAGLVPWFDVAARPTHALKIVFGHWAALGLKMTPSLLAVDTGCVWGEKLTAVRFGDDAVFQVAAEYGMKV